MDLFFQLLTSTNKGALICWIALFDNHLLHWLVKLKVKNLVSKDLYWWRLLKGHPTNYGKCLLNTQNWLYKNFSPFLDYVGLLFALENILNLKCLFVMKMIAAHSIILIQTLFSISDPGKLKCDRIW